ncbi:MAG: hypothetical protein O7F76_02180 [Planctomycetota bacterium]|nr:hypothetical protein [Planctomycetota bacterium]
MPVFSGLSASINSFVFVAMTALSLFAGPRAAAADPPAESRSDTIFIVERTGQFNQQPSRIGSFPGNDPSDVTILGASNPAPVFYGIDAHPGTDQLYGIARTPNVTTGSLYTIDSQTGLASIVGDVNEIDLNPINFGGLSFNLNGTFLLGTDSDFLFAIDIVTGELIDGWSLEIDGGEPDFQIAALAVATTDSPFIEQGTLIGLAVYPDFPLPQPAEIVDFAFIGMTAEMTVVTTIATPEFPVFSQVAFDDQGLDFSPDGILYACLMGTVHSATLFTIELSRPALGDAIKLGRVGDEDDFSTWWGLGGIAVNGTTPVVCGTCPGDLDGDNDVDARDVTDWIVAAIAYGETSQIPPGMGCADIDDDGDIDFSGASSDLELFIQRLLASQPACASP